MGTRRIEIGSGARPSAGYIHVDIDSWAPHVEVLSEAWNLPFENDWADEILAIHCLEHIHPKQLSLTLAEWYRVLAPGGVLRVHVPNAPALMERYSRSTVSEKWALNSALLGMNANPMVRSPADVPHRGDHQILFDETLLVSVLEDAGFTDVADRTGEVTDVHVDAWRPMVESVSMVFEARKGEGRS